jgi:hypothetical protein
MIGRICSAAAAASLCCSAPALAQESQTFTYDVHGRLTAVVRTSGATIRTTNYALDQADNRTQRATTVSGSSAAALEIPGPLDQADEKDAAGSGGAAASAPTGAPRQDDTPVYQLGGGEI